uniref:NADH dehydrogenase subunit 2 n=1 Tax=Kalophrynus palmatissimus TaxID=1035774 RepID=UPI00226CC4CA|nr:NADH dehydrogenase subunit 2 [Kalophrynus palmatissimus]UZC57478.1 NADH dehydrogenase subunit 2 [Kalophrynus palmatissimus]
MTPLALFIFISSLATGTTITLASHHWMLAWLGLEINTLAIIPLMTKNPHPRAIEAATKYFLTQAAASALILFSALINAWLSGEWFISSSSELTAVSLSIAICMKLGLAPLHFWMPEVLQGIPLSTGLILSTWQKIAPMALLIQISQSTNLQLMMILGFTSILIGGWGGINQTQIRKIMAFSSIGHLGWMIIIIKLNPTLTMFNFILYILMTATMFTSLIILNTTKISQLTLSWPKTPVLSTTLMLTILSLSGLPPLTGFAPKLMISFELIKQHAILLTSLILLASLLALFFYIRLTYILSLTMAPNTTSSQTIWRSPFKKPSILAIFNSSTIFLLPISPTIITLI